MFSASFVFHRLLCLSAKNKFPYYIIFFIFCGALATISTILLPLLLFLLWVPSQSNLYFKNDFGTLFRIWICIFIYLFRSYDDDDAVALCACCFSPFLFSVCFALFILSTLNKYHEKCQRSLTSNREISEKKENKLQEIEPLPVSQIFSQIKPAIWAHGSDELRARFQKKY